MDLQRVGPTGLHGTGPTGWLREGSGTTEDATGLGSGATNDDNKLDAVRDGATDAVGAKVIGAKVASGSNVKG